MASDLNRFVKVAASLSRRFIQEAHRRIAATWPHGVVGTSPAPVGEDLKRIATWTRIPWFGTGIVSTSTGNLTAGVPLPDQTFREVLKKPFTYHRSQGRVDGLLLAVSVLGYAGASYLDWQEVFDCPTWVPPGGGGPVPNQNAFGLLCPLFPQDWQLSMGAPALGTPLDTLIRVINETKRASARLVEIRRTQNVVVTQSWWDGPRDPSNVVIVRTQSSTDVAPVKVTSRP